MSLDARARLRQRIAAQTAILAVLIAFAVLGHLYYGLRNHFFDLEVYRDAMLWWNGGHPLYDYSRPDETQGTLGFTYPPAGAFLLRPLAFVEPDRRHRGVHRARGGVPRGDLVVARRFGGPSARLGPVVRRLASCSCSRPG